MKTVEPAELVVVSVIVVAVVAVTAGTVLDVDVLVPAIGVG